MVIYIDIGNSNIKYTSDFEQYFRISTVKTKSSDEYSIYFTSKYNEVEGVVISSVVPELNDIFRRLFVQNFNVEPIVVGPGVKTGINLLADNPKEVGADLICGAVGAVSKYGKNCIVIDQGTATTFTYIEGGCIKGVTITSGLITCKEALISKTSLLPQFELVAPKKVLGTNSIACLQAGLVYGHAFMIDGMCNAIIDETNNTKVKIISTGGISKTTIPLCKSDIIIDEFLLFRGLKAIYKRNN